MQLSDGLFVLMWVSLAAIAGILVYAVSKRIKIDSQGNRHLLFSVLIFTFVLLASTGTYVFITTS